MSTTKTPQLREPCARFRLDWPHCGVMNQRIDLKQAGLKVYSGQYQHHHHCQLWMTHL
jgi:hypothetical protein